MRLWRVWVKDFLGMCTVVEEHRWKWGARRGARIWRKALERDWRDLHGWDVWVDRPTD